MRTLRAGPLSLVLEPGGSVRYVRVKGHEVLRRIYVAVRDRNWDTVPARVFNVDVREADGSFRVTFDAQCVQGDIDFAWRGTITGSPSGSLTFGMDGEARAMFQRNRIGICVLHPVRECAGAACTVETADGGLKKGAFPKYVWPNPPFKDIRALWHSPAPGLSMKLAFEGDVFEMEDQRNWTDASFKTYSTPLERPFPVEVPRGTRIGQTLTLTLEEDRAEPRAEVRDLVLDVSAAPAQFLPSLGLGSAGSGFVLRPPELERLRALRPAHLRVDLDLQRPDWADVLHRAESEARGLSTALELAAHLTGDAAEQLEALKAALAAEKPRLARVLVFHVSEKSTTARTIRQAREVLGPLLGTTPLGAGTNAYFAELNRGEPPKNADVVAWSINPQVHDEDDATLVENLEAQAWVVQSARLFAPERPLAVTPVTLRPRFNPNATAPGAAAPAVDPRQWTLFGAAWTVGSFKYLAEAGASSITYYETAGARGVMDRDPRPVYPLYHALADIADMGVARIVPTRSTDPLRLDGWAAAATGRKRLVVASFHPEAQRATVVGLPARVAVRSLNVLNADEAGRDPAAFRARPGEPRETRDGRLELELMPFEVVRIDG